MTVLIVCPDYASHYFPLSALGSVWQADGVEVVVATGPSLAQRVLGDGFIHRELVLGAGSNKGLARPEEQRPGEDEHLRAFFDATRRGMLPTLRYQARARLHDLLWRPEEVTGRLQEIVREVRPRIILSDQIAFSATVALEALARPYVSFVTGHPESLPGPGEVYGFPSRVPERFMASEEEMGKLRNLCGRVRERFTAEFNHALSKLAPDAPPVSDAFAVTSAQLTLFNYPRVLAERRRQALPSSARFLGSAVRHETAEPGLEAELETADLPTVYVSLGSFLSARYDVLERIVDALREAPLRVVLASGVADVRSWDVPSHWIVRPYLPQVAVLRHCHLVVCHGGNNTVTEAFAAGLPLLVGPFSTDQFAVAADLEAAGLGEVFDPNGSPPEEIARRVARLLSGEFRQRARELGAKLGRDPGPQRAVRWCRELAKL